MNEKIIRQVGDCKVTITFGDSNPDLKENLMWAMMENYKKRILEQESEDGDADRRKS